MKCDEKSAYLLKEEKLFFCHRKLNECYAKRRENGKRMRRRRKRKQTEGKKKQNTKKNSLMANYLIGKSNYCSQLLFSAFFGFPPITHSVGFALSLPPSRLFDVADFPDDRAPIAHFVFADNRLEIGQISIDCPNF